MNDVIEIRMNQNVCKLIVAARDVTFLVISVVLKLYVNEMYLR